MCQSFDFLRPALDTLSSFMKLSYQRCLRDLPFLEKLVRLSSPQTEDLVPKQQTDDSQEKEEEDLRQLKTWATRGKYYHHSCGGDEKGTVSASMARKGARRLKSMANAGAVSGQQEAGRMHGDSDEMKLSNADDDEYDADDVDSDEGDLKLEDEDEIVS